MHWYSSLRRVSRLQIPCSNHSLASESPPWGVLFLNEVATVANSLGYLATQSLNPLCNFCCVLFAAQEILADPRVQAVQARDRAAKAAAAVEEPADAAQ